MDINDIVRKVEQAYDEIEDARECEKRGDHLREVGNILAGNGEVISDARQRNRDAISDAIHRMVQWSRSEEAADCAVGRPEADDMTQALREARNAVDGSPPRNIEQAGEFVADQAEVTFDLPEQGPIACFEGRDPVELQERMNEEIDTRSEDPKSISTGAPSDAQSIKACILFDNDDY